MDTKGERRGGVNWEIGTDIYLLLLLWTEQITKANLLFIIAHQVRLECDPDIPVAPGEEHYVLDPSLDEDSLP